MYLVTMESDATSSPVDGISIMKQALPEYVVNCFFAAGYDTTDVITAMDISDNPGNSIELIEKYISERYPKDPRYCNNPDSDILLAKPFEFPPGHRIRICNFICALRKKIQGENNLTVSIVENVSNRQEVKRAVRRQGLVVSMVVPAVKLKQNLQSLPFQPKSVEALASG